MLRLVFRDLFRQPDEIVPALWILRWEYADERVRALQDAVEQIRIVRAFRTVRVGRVHDHDVVKPKSEILPYLDFSGLEILEKDVGVADCPGKGRDAARCRTAVSVLDRCILAAQRIHERGLPCARSAHYRDNSLCLKSLLQPVDDRKRLLYDFRQLRRRRPEPERIQSGLDGGQRLFFILQFERALGALHYGVSRFDILRHSARPSRLRMFLTASLRRDSGASVVSSRLTQSRMQRSAAT